MIISWETAEQMMNIIVFAYCTGVADEYNNSNEATQERITEDAQNYARTVFRAYCDIEGIEGVKKEGE